MLRLSFSCCRCRAFGILAAVALLLSTLAVQANWLHYRGPSQNGVSPEKLGALGGSAPPVLWNASLGKGTSAVTVSGDRAFSMGNVRDRDVVQCLDAKSGKSLWQFEYPLELDPNMFEGGPRSTPTLDGNRVFTVSHQGDLFCLDAAAGKKVWYHHYQKDFGGRRPSWGFAGSPTVVGNLVICDVGGPSASTVAFDKATGAVVWKSGGDQPGYASPVIATISGRSQAIILKADALVGLSLADGSEIWRTDWKTSYDVNAATPVVIGDQILITSGYNAGASLIEVSSSGAKVLWRNKSIRAHVNSPVVARGFAYGIDGNTGGGNLVCIDLATGAKRWEEKTVKGGALIVADDKLIVLTEKGELVIADANPQGFKAEVRAKVLGNRCWVQPTLSGGRLFLKNNEGEVACVDVGGRR